MLQMILTIAAALVAGAILALRFIAPKTPSPLDDSILKRLEQLEMLIKLIPGLPKLPSAEGEVPRIVVGEESEPEKPGN